MLNTTAKAIYLGPLQIRVAQDMERLDAQNILSYDPLAETILFYFRFLCSFSVLGHHKHHNAPVGPIE